MGWNFATSSLKGVSDVCPHTTGRQPETRSAVSCNEKRFESLSSHTR